MQQLKAKIATLVPLDPPEQADYTADVSRSVPMVKAIQDYAAALIPLETSGKDAAQRLQQLIKGASEDDLTPAALKQLRTLRRRLTTAYERDSEVLDQFIAKAEKLKRRKPSTPSGTSKATSPAKKTSAPPKPTRKAAQKVRRTAKPQKSERSENPPDKAQQQSVRRLPKESDIYI